MKIRKVTEIEIENDEEEQFILEKFPGAWWDNRADKIVFVLPVDKYEDAIKALSEYTSYLMKKRRM